MMKLSTISKSVFGSLVLLQGRGGPPPVYRTEIPAHGITVVSGAPTQTSICLSLLDPKSESVKVAISDPEKPAATTTELDVALEADVPKEVLIEKLSAGKVFSYTVMSPSAEPYQGKIVTAKGSSQPFVFDVQADSHLDGNCDTKVYENTLQNVNADRPDFFIDLGDTFMVDKYPAYRDAYKQYLAQRYWFSLVGRNMPVFLCLGNHDGEVGWRGRGGELSTKWSQEQREKFFPVIRPDRFYSGAPKAGLYYAWKWGDAQFIVLDPFVATTQKAKTAEDGWNWTLGKPQFSWLEETLKSSKAKFKFVFIHHLVGGFGREARGGVEAADRFEWGAKDEYPTKRTGWAEPIHQMFKRYGISAVFHGHDHLYVKQERDGIVYLEVPQPSQARGDNINSAEEYGYKEGKILGSSGHIRVSVGSKTAKVEYVRSRLSKSNRAVSDSFEISAGRP